MSKDSRYWFPAKRLGWGWGLPSTWQGWLVLLVLLVAVASAGIAFLPGDPVRFTVVTLGCVLAFFLVCLLKGEPPSWRWGEDQ